MCRHVQLNVALARPERGEVVLAVRPVWGRSRTLPVSVTSADRGWLSAGLAHPLIISLQTYLDVLSVVARKRT
jgi:hypothetical protein